MKKSCNPWDCKTFLFFLLCRRPQSRSILATICQQTHLEKVKWGQNGGLGAFFRSPIYIFILLYIRIYLKKQLPIPPKIPGSLENTHFFMGDFLENTPKKAPIRGKKPPQGKKHPAGHFYLAGCGDLYLDQYFITGAISALSIKGA